MQKAPTDDAPKPLRKYSGQRFDDTERYSLWRIYKPFKFSDNHLTLQDIILPGNYSLTS